MCTVGGWGRAVQLTFSEPLFHTSTLCPIEGQLQTCYLILVCSQTSNIISLGDQATQFL